MGLHLDPGQLFYRWQAFFLALQDFGMGEARLYEDFGQQPVAQPISDKEGVVAVLVTTNQPIAL